MKTYYEFLRFIEEREAIRSARDNGFPGPWTKDTVLERCRFRNISRNHDKGTILLFKFIREMPELEKLLYITLYRSCWSSSDFLNHLSGLWVEDVKIISKIKMDFKSDRIPYQIYLKQGQSINEFLLTSAFMVVRDFYKLFNNMKGLSIISASSALENLFKYYHGKKMILLSSEIIKDLSFFYPDKINPDSECHLHVRSRQALNRISGNVDEIKIRNLLFITSRNFVQIECGLSEWDRYCERREYFQKKESLRKNGNINNTPGLFISLLMSVYFAYFTVKGYHKRAVLKYPIIKIGNKMRQHSKEFKEQSLRLSDEVGLK